MERQIDSSRLRTGNVIRTVIINPDDPTKSENCIFWIRGNNGFRDVGRRVLRVEDQLGRLIRFPVIDVLGGKIGAYTIEGVYSPRDLGLEDPRSIRTNGVKDFRDETGDCEATVLEPPEPGTLGLNTTLRISQIIGRTPIDEFDLTIVEVIGDKLGERTFSGVDLLGNLYEMIYEEDILKGRLGALRFDGIVPQKENKEVDPFGSTQGQS